MSPYDQQVYDAGFKFVPQTQYLLNPFQIPPGNTVTTDPNTGAGIPSINIGGGGGGGGGNPFTGGISDLTSGFQTAVDDRQNRLLKAYNEPSTAKILGMDLFKQDVNPADAGFYVGEGMRVPQERTMLGKMFMPQSAEEIMQEGYKPMTNIGILSNILGKVDKFGTLPRADQAFISSQMGYTGPSVFGENQSGLSKDPFGLNTRSAFGNYAERVGVEAKKLGEALTKSAAKRGLTFDPSKGALVDAAGNVIDEDEYDAAMQDFINKTNLMRTKFGFYTQKTKERNELREQDAQNIRNEIAAAAAAKNRAAARAAIKRQGEASYTPSIHGGTDYGRDSEGKQSFDFGGGFGIGSDGGPVSNRTGRGRTGYMLGGLTDLVDIYD